MIKSNFFESPAIFKRARQNVNTNFSVIKKIDIIKKILNEANIVHFKPPKNSLLKSSNEKFKQIFSSYWS